MDRGEQSRVADVLALDGADRSRQDSGWVCERPDPNGTETVAWLAIVGDPPHETIVDHDTDLLALIERNPDVVHIWHGTCKGSECSR